MLKEVSFVLVVYLSEYICNVGYEDPRGFPHRVLYITISPLNDQNPTIEYVIFDDYDDVDHNNDDDDDDDYGDALWFK